MARFVELLLLLALVLLMVYMVQARDTDGDGILDAGKTTDGPTWVDSVFKVYNTNVVNTNVTD